MRLSLQKNVHAFIKILEIFKDVKLQWKKKYFLIFAQNIDCVYMAVITSAHNLCFGAKIRKIGIPLHTPISLYKSGVQGDIHSTDMFYLYKMHLAHLRCDCSI